VRRRLAGLTVAVLAGVLPLLGVGAQGAHAAAKDHIWYCVGVDKPVDMSYCQHNPWAYPPLNGDTPTPPRLPAIPVPIPSP
jgi:hypothetical protein